MTTFKAYQVLVTMTQKFSLAIAEVDAPGPIEAQTLAMARISTGTVLPVETVTLAEVSAR